MEEQEEKEEEKKRGTINNSDIYDESKLSLTEKPQEHKIREANSVQNNNKKDSKKFGEEKIP